MVRGCVRRVGARAWARVDCGVCVQYRISRTRSRRAYAREKDSNAENTHCRGVCAVAAPAYHHTQRMRRERAGAGQRAPPPRVWAWA